MGDSSVLIVSGKAEFGDEIARLMAGEGFVRAELAASVNEARRRLGFMEPELVIVSLPLPDEPGVHFAAELARETPAAVIVLVKAELLSRIQGDIAGAGGFVLPKPVSKSLLAQTARVAVQTRKALRAAVAERDGLQRRMDERKTVEQAKWILVKALSISEPDAHRYIQKLAMDLRTTQMSVALEIIEKYG